MAAVFVPTYQVLGMPVAWPPQVFQVSEKNKMGTGTCAQVPVHDIHMMARPQKVDLLLSSLVIHLRLVQVHQVQILLLPLMVKAMTVFSSGWKTKTILSFQMTYL